MVDDADCVPVDGPLTDTDRDHVLLSPAASVQIFPSPWSGWAAKLGRAKAAERHLVIVLDSFSQPGIGIPLKRSSRRDAGAAAYVMPLSVPSAPLSHMWLLPMAEGSEGLRWTRGSGWAILAV